MKILSFIIPAYNSESFLEKCITSIVDETLMDKIEIIVVNDGSVDDTPLIAQKYCDIYPESVRLISQENKGHGGALNTGCASANGKYLKVVDADDWVETQNLSDFISFLEKYDSDVVLTHHYTIDISNGETKKWMSYPGSFGKSYSFSEIMKNFSDFERSLTFHGITYNTVFYQSHSYKLSEHVFYEDHEYATFPCCFAKTVTPLDIFIYDYRVGDVNQSVSNANQLKRKGHCETVLTRMVAELNALPSDFDSSAYEYVCRKIKTVLVSYLTTVLLVEGNKKLGRQEAKRIMEYFKSAAPRVFEMTLKKYRVFCLFSVLHSNKNVLDRLINSRVYKKLSGSHDFN